LVRTENKQEERIELFGKWSVDNVEVTEAGLKRYISVGTTYLPHSGGRHEHKKFRKSNVSIVERLVNSMMRHGRSGGKKAKTEKIVRSAFDIVNLKTGLNPVEVLVRAVQNAAPCEDTTRITYGGIVYHMSVDVAPQRRVDVALRFTAVGAENASSGTQKTIEECLADELIFASQGDNRSYAVKKRNEMERIALSSR
jgi:small subunit ribosomal protein S7